MSSRCGRDRAEETISELTRLLNEAHLSALIDEPVDRVAAGVRHERAEADSVAGLHEVAARFVQRLYAEALPGMRKLSASQALDEAITLLERGYAGRGANGYFEAVLDATDESHGGIEVALLKMADVVKVRRRALYVNWLVARHIDPTDWELKCSLASLLLDRCEPFLSPQLQGCSPERTSAARTSTSRSSATRRSGFSTASASLVIGNASCSRARCSSLFGADRCTARRAISTLRDTGRAILGR